MTIWEIQKDLWARGYAVILVSPDKLAGLHPTDAEATAWDSEEQADARRDEEVTEYFQQQGESK